MAKKEEIVGKETKLSVFDELKMLKTKQLELSDRLVGDLAREFAKIAESYQLFIDSVGSKDLWSDPQFVQSLDILGLQPVTSEVRVKKPAREVPPIRETEFGTTLAKIVKEKQKATAEDVIKGVGDRWKPNSVKAGLAKLVGEGVLYRPERGIFSVK